MKLDLIRSNQEEASISFDLIKEPLRSSRGATSISFDLIKEHLRSPSIEDETRSSIEDLVEERLDLVEDHLRLKI